MCILNTQPICILQGDTQDFEVEITTQNGQPYVLQEGDQLVFTLKVSQYASQSLLEIQITGTAFTITAAQSAALPCGDLVYDIQLTQANGDVTTVIPPSTFTVLPDVSGS